MKFVEGYTGALGTTNSIS